MRPMKDFSDLEIGLHRRSNSSDFDVEFRFSRPDSETEVRPEPGTVNLDLEKLGLLAKSGDADGYGELLTESFFHDESVKTAVAQVRAATESDESVLRIRLNIGRTAPELQVVHWEGLRDPAGGAPLFMGERVLFSRYLAGQDWTPVRLRAESDLNALVAIANPTDLEDYNLAAVDVAGELDRARTGLDEIPITALDSGGKATLGGLIEALRRDEPDILYLVCHGALVKGEPWLWLEEESGAVARVSGKDLVTRIAELERRPKLVVLASCQSAGTGADADGVLTALGPQLAGAGVPAVIAMQGSISMQTVSEFMPALFRELHEHGHVDRAMAVARGVVRERPDAWMPVLFMRLTSGRIWYRPGFGEDDDFDKWPAVLSSIERGRCTPLLGPGIAERLVGSQRQIAERWSSRFRFPMSREHSNDLAHVAQFLAVNQQSEQFPRDELEDTLREEIRRRHEAELDGLDSALLDELVSKVGTLRRERDPMDTHKIVAGLPFPIYITTSPHGLLEDALREAGKDPQRELCRWNEDIEMLPSVFDGDDYRPTPEKPLVYHLFGHMSEPDSLVLTEDDYFDYLIGVTKNEDLIPKVVRAALVNTALLFLGFRLHDWNFRVLYRSLMLQEGGRRRAKYAHVAAQIDPEEGHILEPEGARKYLETYFQDARISIYWGNADDFIKEFVERSEKATK